MGTLEFPLLSPPLVTPAGLAMALLIVPTVEAAQLKHSSNHTPSH